MHKFVPAVFAAVSLVFAASAGAQTSGRYSNDHEVRTPSSPNESGPSFSSHDSSGRFTGSASAYPRTPSSVSESAPTRNHQEQAYTGATGGSVTVREARGGRFASPSYPSSVSESAPALAR